MTTPALGQQVRVTRVCSRSHCRMHNGCTPKRPHTNTWEGRITWVSKDGTGVELSRRIWLDISGAHGSTETVTTIVATSA